MNLYYCMNTIYNKFENNLKLNFNKKYAENQGNFKVILIPL